MTGRRRQVGAALALLAALAAAAAALAGCGGSGPGTTGPTRARIAREAGLARSSSGGWHSEECEIPRIYTTRAEVTAAEEAERKRQRPDGIESPGGIVISGEGDRFGVELGHEYFYCQQAIEEALAHVGHGGIPPRHPATVANARRAIEALGYPIRLEEPSGEPGVLAGRVHGSLGERFAFFLFVDRSAPERMPGVPGYPGFSGRRGLLGGGLTDGYIFGSREVARAGESGPQFKQQSKIEGEVESALCFQEIGEECGI